MTHVWPDRSPALTSMSGHTSAADSQLRPLLGARVRKLHARIGKAHHHAEGMAFSKAFLAGAVTPLQLAALLRALAPAYALLEQHAPPLALTLGATTIPWSELARSPALAHDLALLGDLPATAPSAAAQDWLAHLQALVARAPHRLMAHVYVRYAGDLSGGQQLAEQARRVLARQGLNNVEFWQFSAPTVQIKAALHDGIEELVLTDSMEAELLDEAETAFLLTQRLFAELSELG